MSDVDKSSKTEPPTAKKLSESRSKGQFAKAPEIGMTLTMLAGLVVILFYGPSKALDVMAFTKSIMQNLHTIKATQEGMATTLQGAFIFLGVIVFSYVSFDLYCGICGGGFTDGFSPHSQSDRA